MSSNNKKAVHKSLILQTGQCSPAISAAKFQYLLTFIKLQALSCLFPVSVFGLLALSHLFSGFIPRYDFMLLGCILVQILLYRLKIETRDEVLVICLFHLLGLMMELFKIHIGSWAYPEPAYIKIAGVPLYSGFMYASVASYLCQAWRRFNLDILAWPKHWIAKVLGACIYLNFFTNHFIIDLRYFIGLFICFYFRKSAVQFTVNHHIQRVPTLLCFLLVGILIWIGENLATRLGAWKYAYQPNGWAMVDYQKISSWGFLVIVSFIIVAELKLLKGYDKPRAI